MPAAVLMRMVWPALTWSTESGLSEPRMMSFAASALRTPPAVTLRSSALSMTISEICTPGASGSRTIGVSVTERSASPTRVRSSVIVSAVTERIFAKCTPSVALAVLPVIEIDAPGTRPVPSHDPVARWIVAPEKVTVVLTGPPWTRVSARPLALWSGVVPARVITLPATVPMTCWPRLLPAPNSSMRSPAARPRPAQSPSVRVIVRAGALMVATAWVAVPPT